MPTRGARAGWYLDPDDPAHIRRWNGTQWAVPKPHSPSRGRSTVFSRTFVWGVMIGLATGGGGGTAVFPVIGTIIGAICGLIVGVPLSVIVALVVDSAAREPSTAASYLRTVDVTLVVLAVTMAVLAAFVIGELASAAIVMFAIAVVGLVVIRPRLRRFVQYPTQSDSSALCGPAANN